MVREGGRRCGCLLDSRHLFSVSSGLMGGERSSGEGWGLDYKILQVCEYYYYYLFIIIIFFFLAPEEDVRDSERLQDLQVRQEVS